jgi:hypothetical protein
VTNKKEQEVDVETVGETENYMAWLSEEPDGEMVVHLELGSVTLHFFREEWQELTQLIESARKTMSGK